MAITSIGYDGSVDETAWTRLMGRAAGTAYGVLGPNDLKVTAHPTLARGVVIGTGHGWGHGVYDISDATATLQGADITTGIRWDMVVARRNWTGVGGATTFVLITGTSTKTLVSRNTTPGTMDDQPLALVQFSGGTTAPTAIVDLRVWAGNGGLYATDLMARDYNTQIGSRLLINGEDWVSVVVNGLQTWQRQTAMQTVQLFGAGTSLLGGVAPAVASSSFYVQAGTNVAFSDGSGYARVTFPTPFPNGLLTVMLTNGAADVDRTLGHVVTLTPAGNPRDVGDKSGVSYAVACEDSTGTNRLYMLGNFQHRVNYIAIGW